VLPGPDANYCAELESSALAVTFRGKLCDQLLPGRVPVHFEKGDILYDAGAGGNSFYFIREGVVSLGSVSADGHEIIYDLRKSGDVVGELCVCEVVRRDRAVALEHTRAIIIPYREILSALQQNRAALQEVLRVFAGALLSAYDQTELLFVREVTQRVIKTLQRLARELGRDSGDFTEIEAYLTQEELSRMVGASRERVSSALNALRTRGMIRYSRGGHLLLDLNALDVYSRSGFEADNRLAPITSGLGA
jgi:CRP-like cAMP-binding protein